MLQTILFNQTYLNTIDTELWQIVLQDFINSIVIMYIVL